jgi:hypothetical protein
MLHRMSPEHKFGTAARLSSEVLGGVADETLDLAACGEVLADALRILTSEHIKVRLVTGHSSSLASTAGGCRAVALMGTSVHACQCVTYLRRSHSCMGTYLMLQQAAKLRGT